MRYAGRWSPKEKNFLSWGLLVVFPHLYSGMLKRSEVRLDFVLTKWIF